jgi:uncharacterized protein YcbX
LPVRALCRSARIGFAPVKGGRDVERPVVDLGPEGPAGDRVLCLVDPARDRVLRTVENPTLVRAVATLDGPRLTVRLGADRWHGVPAPTGDVRTVDYWGREAKVELLAGPWAGPLSAHLGLEVALARPARAGAVVYGGSVSLVTTSSLHRLSAEVGAPVEGARFRPTFVVDTGTAAPYVEDHWAGRELSVGSAVVRVGARYTRARLSDAPVPFRRKSSRGRRGSGRP